MKNRKILYIIISFLIVSIATLIIAYSALSTVLKISGTSEVQQANWNIKFDNIVIKYGSVAPTKKAMVTSPQQVEFEINLKNPGDFYEFTVDIVNDGSIDAMIESIIKTPELTLAQQKYALYEITYNDGNSVGLKQLLKAKSQKTIKVRVAYKTDLIASDLPKNQESLNLSFQAIFTQADSSNIVGPEGPGGEIPKIVRMVKGDISTPQIGDMFAIKNEKFYIYSSTETTVTGIAEYNLYVGGEHDRTKWTPYGSEATGIQNSEMVGWINDYNVTKGSVEFSSENHKGINYSDYKGSIVEEYVNNYNDTLKKYGAKIEETRLITHDELVNIFKCQEKGFCSTEYPWIYKTTYWTESSQNQNNIYFVIINGFFSYGNYDVNGTRGVRPVVTILKSEF